MSSDDNGGLWCNPPITFLLEGSYTFSMAGNGAPSIINISAFIVFILYDNKCVYKLMMILFVTHFNGISRIQRR